MTHSAKIIADSLSPSGHRLTTMEVTFPRIVLSEFNTHRAFSRNSASSRAIPVEKMIERVMTDPYVPSEWPANCRGMSASENTPAGNVGNARFEWLDCRDCAVDGAWQLLRLGIHKQITNRLLEPFLWHTVIVSATEWGNFFKLRCAPDAHPEIRRAAELMRDALAASKPVERMWGEWHLPLVTDGERDEGGDWRKASVGRCARVSCLTHNGKRDPAADIELHDRLLGNGHMSPFEHIARPGFGDGQRNFVGWEQYRALVERPVAPTVFEEFGQ